MLGPPQVLHPFAPAWSPVFWNLAERTPEHLLSCGPWMQLMTMMRVSGKEQAELQTFFTAAIRKVNVIRETEHGRWYELLRMMLAFTIWRRPAGERDSLIQIAERENPANQEEVRVMALTGAQAYMMEGEIRQARRDVQRLLQIRFGSVPEGLQREIETISDLDRLTSAFDRAATVRQLDEFKP